MVMQFVNEPNDVPRYTGEVVEPRYTGINFGARRRGEFKRCAEGLHPRYCHVIDPLRFLVGRYNTF